MYIIIMSSNFFILTKSDDIITDVTTFSEKKVYILPYNNFNCYIRNGLFENSLINWCAQFCNSSGVFLDIGAHSGTYTVSLAKYCKEVYSFEPQKQTYYSLCGSVALSNLKNVTCLQYGLGSETQRGTQTLHIVSHDGGGSTLHLGTTVELGQESIEIKTLDDFAIDNVCFIKMDVENNEYFLLLGAHETLKRNNYPRILFEVNDNENNYKDEIFTLLDSYGYNIANITGYSNMFLASI